MRPALVIGADGMIGAALIAALRRDGVPVLATTRRKDRVNEHTSFLDLGLFDATVVPVAPGGVAYLCAAMAQVDACRRDPQGTRRINVEAMRAVARRLTTAGMSLVFLSTNRVFDGRRPFATPQDPVSPRTEYGRQKAAAEQALLALRPGDVAVLRLTKVVHPGMPLLTGWSTALANGQAITPFSDMAIAPVPVADVVTAARRLGEEGRSGIVHLSATRDVTYADIGYHLARMTGVNEDLVRPVSWTSSNAMEEPPPAFTALDCATLPGLCGVTPPDPLDAIERVMRDQRDRQP